MHNSKRRIGTITRIIHTGDIHLGYSTYGKLTYGGVNQRMEDVFNSFDNLVDACIGATAADVLIISGDLFHTLKPSMSTLAFCMEQMNRLSKNKVKVLIVGGNHDTPKSKSVSSPLETLKFFDNVTCAIDEIQKVTIGNVEFIMMPYIYDKKLLMEGLSKARAMKTKGLVSFIIVHLAYGKFKMMQYDEVCVSPEEMEETRKTFDYTAMGHFHGSFLEDSGHMISYSGSLERLSFNEKDDEKGFFEIDVDEKTLGVSVSFVKNKAREMFDLPDVDLVDTTSPTTDIVDALKGVDLKGKIFRMKVKNIPALLYRALDFRELRKKTEPATNFEFIFEIQEEVVEYEEVEKKSFRSMADEWNDFAKTRSVGEDLTKLGRYYIQKVEIN